MTAFSLFLFFSDYLGMVFVQYIMSIVAVLFRVALVLGNRFAMLFQRSNVLAGRRGIHHVDHWIGT